MDNNQNQNPNIMMNGIPPMPKEEKKIGPIVAVLIAVLALIIVALYFFGKRLNTEPSTNPANTTEEVVTEENTNEENTANLSSSIDSASIEADLDVQLQDIDYSF